MTYNGEHYDRDRGVCAQTDFQPQLETMVNVPRPFGSSTLPSTIVSSLLADAFLTSFTRRRRATLTNIRRQPSHSRLSQNWPFSSSASSMTTGFVASRAAVRLFGGFRLQGKDSAKSICRT